MTAWKEDGGEGGKGERKGGEEGEELGIRGEGERGKGGQESEKLRIWEEGEGGKNKGRKGRRREEKGKNDED